jgi:transcriptional regulator with XRE-family HTH domain
LNFSTLVRSRLAKLGLGQKDLAQAAQVTDSYISQLLSRKKAPPAPDRTDIYKRMERFLGLQSGELGRMAENERAKEIQRRLGRAPEPLFQEFRDLVLGKCVREKRDEIRSIFEAQPFGTLERLVAQSLLGVIQRVARQELDSESWIRLTAKVGARSHEEMRVLVLEFLDTDVHHVSNENCIAFIDPLLEQWDFDLESFRLDVRLNPGLVAEPHRRFRFVESAPDDESGDEPGLADFLRDSLLSGDVTEEELRILRGHTFGGWRPTKMYYYRALQALRDPLHFQQER